MRLALRGALTGPCALAHGGPVLRLIRALVLRGPTLRPACRALRGALVGHCAPRPPEGPSCGPAFAPRSKWSCTGPPTCALVPSGPTVRPVVPCSTWSCAGPTHAPVHGGPILGLCAALYVELCGAKSAPGPLSGSSYGRCAPLYVELYWAHVPWPLEGPSFGPSGPRSARCRLGQRAPWSLAGLSFGLWWPRPEVRPSGCPPRAARSAERRSSRRAAVRRDTPNGLHHGG